MSSSVEKVIRRTVRRPRLIRDSLSVAPSVEVAAPLGPVGGGGGGGGTLRPGVVETRFGLG